MDQESHVLLDFSNCKLNLSFPSTCEVWGPLQIDWFAMQQTQSFDMEIMSAGN